jgi:hypothetical protein
MANLSISDLTYKVPILGLIQEVSPQHEKNVQTFTGLPSMTIVAGSTKQFMFDCNGYITTASDITPVSSAAVTAGGSVGTGSGVSGYLTSLSISGTAGSPVSFSASLIGTQTEAGTALTNSTDIGDIVFGDSIAVNNGSATAACTAFSMNMNWEIEATEWDDAGEAGAGSDAKTFVFKSFSGTMSVTGPIEATTLDGLVTADNLDDATITLGVLQFSGVNATITKSTLVSGAGEVPVLKRDYTLSSIG